jgi:hypothetical protein
MGSGPNMIFNIVSVVFLVLTVITIVIVLGVAMDSMDPPVFAPPTDIPPATEAVFPTFTPSPVPTEPMMAPEATQEGQ